ncbi:MAG: M48 family metallopeptidase, partial [Anaeromyxobacteraceae bacterium]|nr:M48 family metallopeptidase [Anaeromyxobacteraceae bacterium]
GVLAALRARAPAAEADARAAGEAYRAGAWQEAFDGYGRVLAAAPGFDHALRRQCRARHRLDDRAAALPLCRAALAAARTPANQVALAETLVDAGAGKGASRAELTEAAGLARAALAGDREDPSTAQQACHVALRAEAYDLLEGCTARLQALAPGELGTEYFSFFGALVKGRHGEARRHLAAARAAGLAPEQADRLEGFVDDAEPAWSRWGGAGLWLLGGWAAVLVLLLGAGAALSAATLRGARAMATDRAAGGGRGARALRRVYGAVLWLTCAVYYLSLPLVVLLVAAAGYAMWTLFAAIGRIPVKLAAVVAIMALVSLWAVLKSLWASVMRREGGDPGLRLQPGEHPRFDAALAQAAARVGTRPVDAVFLTPGTDAAVYERGNLARRLSGRTERRLILGVGLLDGMTQGQLKAVLAHEYGHFVNRDTAGGGLALSVRRSVLQMAESLASGGAAAWYNPAWLFVTNFHKLFLRVSQGASRLQEILADRWAALAYGGQNFAAGLSHVVARSIRFDKLADASLREVVDGGLGLRNLYRYTPATPPPEAAVAAEIERAMQDEPSPYDSHPRPADRIAWVGDVPSAHGGDLDVHAPAWALFADREALERRLTDEVRANVAAAHGVQIPEETPAPPQAPEAPAAEVPSQA